LPGDQFHWDFSGAHVVVSSLGKRFKSARKILAAYIGGEDPAPEASSTSAKASALKYKHMYFFA